MNIAHSIAAAIGKQFSFTAAGASGAEIFKITKVSDKKFADVGEESNVPYVIFQSTTRATVVKQMKPDNAMKIINGEDSMYVEVGKAEPVAAATKPAKAAKAPKEPKAEKAPKVAKEKKAKVAPAGNKGKAKAACAAIIMDMMAKAEGVMPERKEIMIAFQAAGYSATMSSTYHHKLVKGNWKDALTTAPTVTAQEAQAESAAE